MVNMTKQLYATEGVRGLYKGILLVQINFFTEIFAYKLANKHKRQLKTPVTLLYRDLEWAKIGLIFVFLLDHFGPFEANFVSEFRPQAIIENNNFRVKTQYSGPFQRLIFDKKNYYIGSSKVQFA